MSAPKHTPGPWVVSRTHAGYRIQEPALSRIIADIRWKSSGMDEANARLIAAAPEMAEALRDLLFVCGRCDECVGAMEFRCSACRAHSALKKAGVL
jgi:hypothetical protein